MTDQNELVNKRIISSSLANFIRQPLIRVLTVIGTIVLARVLGPASLAVISTIRANTSSIMSFMDLGISRSIPKILPDISVEYGRDSALLVLKKLLYVKLILSVLGLAGLYLLDYYEILDITKNITGSVWFFPIVGAHLILNVLVIFKQREWTAALKMAEMAKIQIGVAFISPFVVIIATLIWQDPYVVACSQLIMVVLEYVFLKSKTGYDLDSNKEALKSISLFQIFKRFSKYLSFAYLIFIFNSFVFGLPLTVYILSALDVGAVSIGLISVTIAIVKIGEEVANIPLSNLRVTIMARMVAENDQKRFLKIQRIMTSVIVLFSGILAISMFSIAPTILDLLYGEQYVKAIQWGAPISSLALIFNCFSLGNSTIRQAGKFFPVIIGLVLSLLFISISDYIIAVNFKAELWPPLIVFNFVIGRGIFLVITDLVTDYMIFKWKGTDIKFRGIISILIALFISYNLSGIPTDTNFVFDVMNFLVTLISFLLIFKFLGGVGKEISKSLESAVPLKFKWIVSFL